MSQKALVLWFDSSLLPCVCVCVFISTMLINSSIISFHLNSLEAHRVHPFEPPTLQRESKVGAFFRVRWTQEEIFPMCMRSTAFSWCERVSECPLCTPQPLLGMNEKEIPAAPRTPSDEWEKGEKRIRQWNDPRNEWLLCGRRRLSQYFVTKNTHFSYGKPRKHNATCVHISRIHSSLLNVGIDLFIQIIARCQMWKKFIVFFL